MLRDEFGIKQLGKRLKILDAAKSAAKHLPQQPKKTKRKPATPEKTKPVVLAPKPGVIRVL